MGKIKINDKTNIKILVTILVIILAIILFFVISTFVIKSKVSTDVQVTEMPFLEENAVDIEWFAEEELNNDFEEKITENLSKSKREELVTETVELEYQTQYVDDDSLKKGKTKVLQKGKDGTQEIIIRKIYVGDELISDEQVGRRIIEQPTNKIIGVGTGGTSSGAKSSSGKNKIDFNIALDKPSGLTLEQFKKILTGNSQDKNKIFEENAEYFYYIEQEYNINGVFVAALGIHESGWGTSKIATNKKNLFGYGAYDNSSYASAYKYDGYAASIDMIARVLEKNYLNPKGTKLKNGDTAKGVYYNGNTLQAVNKKYATDKNWSRGVYTWMQYLYNRL